MIDNYWNEFINTGKVPYMIIFDIGHKMYHGDVLTPREESVRREHHEVVERILNELRDSSWKK